MCVFLGSSWFTALLCRFSILAASKCTAVAHNVIPVRFLCLSGRACAPQIQIQRQEGLQTVERATVWRSDLSKFNIYFLSGLLNIRQLFIFNPWHPLTLHISLSLQCLTLYFAEFGNCGTKRSCIILLGCLRCGRQLAVKQIQSSDISGTEKACNKNSVPGNTKWPKWTDRSRCGVCAARLAFVRRLQRGNSANGVRLFQPAANSNKCCFRSLLQSASTGRVSQGTPRKTALREGSILFMIYEKCLSPQSITRNLTSYQ